MKRRNSAALLLFLVAVSSIIAVRLGPATGESTGQAFAGPQNTGVPDGTSLERIPGDDYYRITTDGQVLDGIEIDGCIVIEANNVVVRNSSITCGATIPAVWLRSGAGLMVEHNTIRGTKGSAAGVAGSNMVARFNDISGTADGLKVGSNTVVDTNWVHGLWEGMTPSGPTHNDGIQMSGGSNVIIRNNSISHSGPNGNGAVFIKAEGGSISNVEIAGNYLVGFGFTARCANGVTDCRIIGNTFEVGTPKFHPAALTHGAVGEIRCNVWSDGRLIDQNTEPCDDKPGPVTGEPTTTTAAPTTTEAPTTTAAP
ncbi:MAG: right-handed parallel beta-helix repeat-containing protein, partial [Actinomycetota bacterium]|nr:right-handed parallel beta-helix repeat-containing protein [Actinomycetota bacterium]